MRNTKKKFVLLDANIFAHYSREQLICLLHTLNNHGFHTLMYDQLMSELTDSLPEDTNLFSDRRIVQHLNGAHWVDESIPSIYRSKSEKIHYPDNLHIAVAKHFGAVVVTKDKKFHEVAKAEGIQVFSFVDIYREYKIFCRCILCQTAKHEINLKREQKIRMGNKQIWLPSELKRTHYSL